MPFFRIIRRRIRVRRTRRPQSATSRRAYQLHKEQARTLVESRLAHFARLYSTFPNPAAANGVGHSFIYHRVSIRNQKTRWGSCSRKGNLNFSYKLALLPLHLADYIIVHELCHLGQFNHSPAFWSLVALAAPDYQRHQKELRLAGAVLK